MLKAEEIIGKFSTLKNYEKFNLEWTRVCARLNPTDSNKKRREEMEKRAKELGLED